MSVVIARRLVVGVVGWLGLLVRIGGEVMARPTVEAVERDLGRLPAALAASGVAAVALALARKIDNPKTSATAVSMCAKALQDALRELRELAPPEEVRDGVDRVAEQRFKRRARVARAASPGRS